MAEKIVPRFKVEVVEVGGKVVRTHPGLTEKQANIKERQVLARLIANRLDNHLFTRIVPEVP